MCSVTSRTMTSRAIMSRAMTSRAMTSGAMTSCATMSSARTSGAMTSHAMMSRAKMSRDMTSHATMSDVILHDVTCCDDVTMHECTAADVHGDWMMYRTDSNRGCNCLMTFKYEALQHGWRVVNIWLNSSSFISYSFMFKIDQWWPVYI